MLSRYFARISSVHRIFSTTVPVSNGSIERLEKIPLILFMDTHIVVAVKPPTMLCHESPYAKNLKDLRTTLKKYISDTSKKDRNAYIGTVHRIDVPVSGVVVYGMTSKATARLVEGFLKRTPVKKYICVVHGTLKGYNVQLENKLTTRKHSESKVEVQGEADENDDKYCSGKLQYTSLMTFKLPQSADYVTLLDITLETGIIYAQLTMKYH